MDEYKGKVRIAWKNQPLSFHPNAMPAAEAAMGAYEQGNEKFWAMHDKLHEKQDERAPACHRHTATETGRDRGKWKASADQHAPQAAVEAGWSDGHADE